MLCQRHVITPSSISMWWPHCKTSFFNATAYLFQLSPTFSKQQQRTTPIQPPTNRVETVISFLSGCNILSTTVSLCLLKCETQLQSCLHAKANCTRFHEATHCGITSRCASILIHTYFYFRPLTFTLSPSWLPKTLITPQRCECPSTNSNTNNSLFVLSVMLSSHEARVICSNYSQTKLSSPELSMTASTVASERQNMTAISFWLMWKTHFKQSHYRTLVMCHTLCSSRSIRKPITKRPTYASSSTGKTTDEF